MLSTIAPIIFVCIAVIVSYKVAGLGNTTAAIGKGFAASLTALALKFIAFVKNITS